jgi:hypothetical protein
VLAHVTVKAAGAAPTGTVTVTVDGHDYRTKLVRGAAILLLPPFQHAGKQTVTVNYSGDSKVLAGTAKATVTVIDPVAGLAAVRWQQRVHRALHTGARRRGPHVGKAYLNGGWGSYFPGRVSSLDLWTGAVDNSNQLAILIGG